MSSMGVGGVDVEELLSRVGAHMDREARARAAATKAAEQAQAEQGCGGRPAGGAAQSGEPQANAQRAPVDPAVQSGARSRASGCEQARRTQVESAPAPKEPALRRGQRGEEVRDLQKKLNHHGAEPALVEDGRFGPKTEMAVKGFQRKNGIPGNGVAGPKTREALAKPKTPSSPTRPEGPTTPERPTGPERAGAQRSVKGFRETNEQKLKDMLPQQAKHLARSFIDAGRRHNVDPAVLAAIAKHETGNFTSSAFRNKNNAMGVSDARGPIHMPSHEASIDKMAKLLGSTSSGPYKNARTIAEVGRIYAPIGAQNDPTGLNSSWTSGVARFADQFARAR